MTSPSSTLLLLVPNPAPEESGFVHWAGHILAPLSV
jgi:hypothetical protein